MKYYIVSVDELIKLIMLISELPKSYNEIKTFVKMFQDKQPVEIIAEGEVNKVASKFFYWLYKAAVDDDTNKKYQIFIQEDKGE